MDDKLQAHTRMYVKDEFSQVFSHFIFAIVCCQWQKRERSKKDKIENVAWQAMLTI